DFVIEKDLERTVSEIRGEHLVKNGEGDAGFVANAGNSAGAGIEIRGGAGGVGERVIAAIVIADPVAQFAVASGAAESFDAVMFVGRNGLGSKLAANPVGFLGHDHAETVAGGGEGRGASA